MLCKLHSVYNTLHTLCDITQKVSNHYTVEGQFFAFNLEKNYTGQKIFTQTPSVASVTNIGYASVKSQQGVGLSDNWTQLLDPRFTWVR